MKKKKTLVVQEMNGQSDTHTIETDLGLKTERGKETEMTKIFDAYCKFEISFSRHRRRKGQRTWETRREKETTLKATKSGGVGDPEKGHADDKQPSGLNLASAEEDCGGGGMEKGVKGGARVSCVGEGVRREGWENEKGVGGKRRGAPEREVE